MTKARRRFDLPPRVLATAAEVAAYLGRGPTWFDNHRDELERHGFPQPLPVVGGWDRQAIDLWLDGLGGLAPIDAIDHGAAWEAAACG